MWPPHYVGAMKAHVRNGWCLGQLVIPHSKQMAQHVT